MEQLLKWEMDSSDKNGKGMRRIEDEVIDLDTMPHKRVIINAIRGMEVVALLDIAKMIVVTDEETVVTYHDDNSAKLGAGSYSVNGITINCRFYPLPTLPRASKTRDNLRDLKLSVIRLFRDHKKLSVTEYGANLKIFLQNGSSNVTVEVKDLFKALSDLI